MKILVVEDEKMIRNGIVNALKNIPQYSYQVKGANNGKVALEMIEPWQPDVVITDVKMPVMDGLVLSKEIRKKYMSIYVIILSGYQEFAYAQEAIKLGIKEYLIKPVGVEDLEKVMKNLEQLIDKEKKSHRVSKETLEVLRREWLNKLVKRPKEIEQDQLDYAAALGITLKGPSYQMILLQMGEEGYGDNWIKGLEDLTLQELPKEWSPVIWMHKETELAIILNVSASNEYRVENDFTRIHELFNHQFGGVLTVGVGSLYDSIFKLAASFREAMFALGQKDRQMSGKNTILKVPDGELVSDNHLLAIENTLEDAIIKQVKDINRNKLNFILNREFNRCLQKSISLDHINNWAIKILVRTYLELQISYEIPDVVMDQLRNANSVIHIQHILSQELESVMDRIDKLKNSNMHHVVNQCIQYIHDHYKEEITLDILAKYVFVSSTYLSKVFKKHTGKTFVKWLNEYRINKAKEYISLQPARPIYAISEEVGYKDYKYFIRVFKKETGFTPKEYKNNHH
ncbi:response regulator [Bacillaceae bacterium SIJ1]|uniref:response regulator n=1 Tax=Litoribacterium kuwaitense TaxID=1398745 RepID=UPI0013EDEF88|nr:response regulator [Litoribacterium kuwaitense]NGP45426.1 response regulator [Litoribacterium kuwaitense]